ncbi:MAG: DUF1775 domain-containing protein [Solirubrobacterales bacterium]
MTKAPNAVFPLAVLALAVTALLLVVPPAGAHGTLNLYGKNAIAGKRGTLTLTIPHGCLPDATATTKLVMTLGSSWRGAKPRAVEGWESTVARSGDGKWYLTWNATAGGLPNADSGDFPISVRWPKKPGTYNTPTAQYCGTQLMDWDDPFNAAADGDHGYPATYPVPRVRVRATGKSVPSGLAG